MELEGKVAIVTGVSSGIGLAVAKAMLRENVIVAGWSRSKPDLDHKNFYHYAIDVTDKDSVEHAYTKVKGQLGAPSILINNAGKGYRGNFEDMPCEDWKGLFDVNVHGIFYCSQQVIPDMKRQGTGHIINLGSIAGTTGVPEMVGYAATKYAVRGISHSLYKEVREHGIKVTCMNPGSVKTQFFDNVEGMEAHDNMMRPEDIASTMMHTLKAPENYHHVEIEVRPLKPR